MTKDKIDILTHLIDQITAVRPEFSPEEFMEKHWRPFLQTLHASERRMAWQLYLRAQVNDFRTIARYLQGLSPQELENFRPALERVFAKNQTPGEERRAA